MKVLMDVDGVLADFCSAYLEFIGLSDSFKEEDFDTWNSLLIKTNTTDADIVRAFDTPGFAENIEPYQWAKAFVGAIEDEGHEVIFCTAVSGRERKKWILNRWPGRKVVQTYHKELLAKDDVILIDDNEPTIAKFGGNGIVFPRPWNRAKGDFTTVLSQVFNSNILTRANALVNGNRGHDYGHPYDDFKRTAEMINAAYETEFKARDIPIIMQFVKISRQINRPKIDNLVDGAGYWATLEMVMQKEGE